ncbi:hypothetical protein PGT21_008925 [Puccinia graminis f. sp. tritici]|uniref:Uncharacterized protein n=1 Tax=Puccinia graminis f. sp. tritici TaxID=56615 RepID=A0A5B0N5A2_PUCGR|nr:hypothetical protein PGTUg99_027806 [Puccinia graminis f. sp. tritici]KAA1083846.1 hypothetical protein PGT21_008925 [Puccinia graminis f. sp. tritici]
MSDSSVRNTFSAEGAVAIPSQASTDKLKPDDESAAAAVPKILAFELSNKNFLVDRASQDARQSLEHPFPSRDYGRSTVLYLNRAYAEVIVPRTQCAGGQRPKGPIPHWSSLLCIVLSDDWLAECLTNPCPLVTTARVHVYKYEADESIFSLSPSSTVSALWPNNPFSSQSSP